MFARYLLKMLVQNDVVVRLDANDVLAGLKQMAMPVRISQRESLA